MSCVYNKAFIMIYTSYQVAVDKASYICVQPNLQLIIGADFRAC